MKRGRKGVKVVLESGADSTTALSTLHCFIDQRRSYGELFRNVDFRFKMADKLESVNREFEGKNIVLFSFNYFYLEIL